MFLSIHIEDDGGHIPRRVFDIEGNSVIFKKFTHRKQRQPPQHMIRLAFSFCMFNKSEVIEFMQCSNKSCKDFNFPSLQFLPPVVVVAVGSFCYRISAERCSLQTFFRFCRRLFLLHYITAFAWRWFSCSCFLPFIIIIVVCGTSS